MEVHENSFIIPYANLINVCIQNGTFQGITKEFQSLIIEFPYNIGLSKMSEVNETDKIFYAKRIGRTIFTKFVEGKQTKLINKCVICLKQSQNKKYEYFPITMFPGEDIIREPEDRSIKDSFDLETTLKFWERHAIIFEDEMIDNTTVVKECPYSHLWDKIHEKSCFQLLKDFQK